MNGKLKFATVMAASALAATAAVIAVGASSAAASGPSAAQAWAGDASAISAQRQITGTKQLRNFDGALVVNVAKDSPAEKAGIQRGEIIVSVNGAALNQTNALGDALAAAKPGDKVTLEVQSRDGAKRTVEVTLAENPNKAGVGFLGLSYGMGRSFAGAQKDGQKGAMPFGRAARGGMMRGFGPAIIGTVAENSPAAKAGLQAKDIVFEINGKPALFDNSLARVMANAKPGDTLALKVLRLGDTNKMADAKVVELSVTLGENPDKAGAAYLGAQMGGHGMPNMQRAPRQQQNNPARPNRTTPSNPTTKTSFVQG